MARPTNKEELLTAAQGNYEKLWKLVEGLPVAAEEVAFTFDETTGKEAHWPRDKNLRDVFIHLYEWHQLMLNFVAANRDGGKQPFLPAPYNWQNYGKMNIAFWEKHQSTSYADAVAMFKQSHADVMALIETFSGEELFTKKHFPWTGTTSLGGYFVSATSSHYDWAMKKIRKYGKQLKDGK